MQTARVTRRAFLGTSAGALGAAFAAWTGVRPGDPETRVAVVGLGRRGTHHVKTARLLPGVRVTAVCDTATSRIDAILRWARESDGRDPEPFSRLDALLSSTCADAVVVATPADTRLALTLETLRSGCHVFVESPARSLGQARAIREAIAASRAIAQDGLHGHDPYWPLEIEDELAGGRVGDVLRAEVFVDPSEDPAPILDVARRALGVEMPWLVQSVRAAAGVRLRDTEFLFRRSAKAAIPREPSIAVRQRRDAWRGIRLTGSAGRVTLARPVAGRSNAHGLLHFLAAVRANALEPAWSLHQGALSAALARLADVAAERTRPIVLDTDGHCNDRIVENALWAL